MNNALFGVERCATVNTRVYYVRGLVLGQTVINLVGSMPGVTRASLRDENSVIVTRSLRVSWRDVEPRIMSLFRGVVTCTDDADAAVYRTQERRTFSKEFRRQLRIVRPGGE
jgi:hypothetical protein